MTMLFCYEPLVSSAFHTSPMPAPGAEFLKNRVVADDGADHVAEIVPPSAPSGSERWITQARAI